jgi:hypothetical protein
LTPPLDQRTIGPDHLQIRSVIRALLAGRTAGDVIVLQGE